MLLTSYLADNCSVTVITISAVAPVRTGLQLTIKVFILAILHSQLYSKSPPSPCFWRFVVEIHCRIFVRACKEVNSGHKISPHRTGRGVDVMVYYDLYLYQYSMICAKLLYSSSKKSSIFFMAIPPS